MNAIAEPRQFELQATVTSKGQITLPAMLRESLGIVTGSKIIFTCDGTTVTMKPQLPASQYFGFLKQLGSIDTAIAKEQDRY